ncbi:MAG: rhomboid family intramembrane serine protease [Bacteroidales bacterium]|jgi:membrane associated rhomboid family serine protease|nr:rhomboid family intramembrane serine protease [Bacteroidales bacterium]
MKNMYICYVMDDKTTEEKRDLRHAVMCSALLTAMPWAVQVVGAVFSLRLKQYGLQPLELTGLAGIFTMPLLHADWEHLVSNTPAMLLLIFGMFLFYKQGAWRILLCLYMLSGLLTWLMGRSAVHIGASGVVYALAAFHFMSGVIKKVPRQRAFALLVAFLYGGFVWAFFPTLYAGTSVSWEGHLSGLLAGIAFAFYFRDKGPEPPVDPFPDTDDEDRLNPEDD